MTIVITDPVTSRREDTEKALKEKNPKAAIVCFGDPLLAVKYAVQYKIEKLYTAVRMNRMSGIELERLIRTFSPDVRVYFLTADEKEKAKIKMLLTAQEQLYE